MAGASRVLRACRALQSDHPTCSSSTYSRPSLGFPRSSSEERRIQQPSCQKRVVGSSKTAGEIAVISLEEQKKPSGIIEVLSSAMTAEAARAALRLFGHPATTRECWRLQAEILIERGIVGCRSFTLIPVAGSLIGSILCFVEGCFLVLESFFKYFLTISQKLDQDMIMQLLIDAIDMFLVGTALLSFGMSLYVMFMGSNEMKQTKGWPKSKSFGKFNLKRLSDCLEMKSISQAKSKIGHALMLILQAGVVDKFKNVPVTSGLDLACFAGAVLISSASIFLLSRLTMQRTKTRCI